MQIKVIFIRMVLHLDSLWNRGTRDLGNGLGFQLKCDPPKFRFLLTILRISVDCVDVSLTVEYNWRFQISPDRRKQRQRRRRLHLLKNTFNKHFPQEFRGNLDLFSVSVGKEKIGLTEFATNALSSKRNTKN